MIEAVQRLFWVGKKNEGMRGMVLTFKHKHISFSLSELAAQSHQKVPLPYIPGEERDSFWGYWVGNKSPNLESVGMRGVLQNITDILVHAPSQVVCKGNRLLNQVERLLYQISREKPNERGSLEDFWVRNKSAKYRECKEWGGSFTPSQQHNVYLCWSAWKGRELQLAAQSG